MFLRCTNNGLLYSVALLLSIIISNLKELMFHLSFYFLFLKFSFLNLFFLRLSVKISFIYFRGEIIVAKPLDYEKQTLYSLRVVASDGKTVIMFLYLIHCIL